MIRRDVNILLVLMHCLILLLSTQISSASLLDLPSLSDIPSEHANYIHTRNLSSPTQQQHEHDSSKLLDRNLATAHDSKWIALETVTENFDDDPVTGFGLSIATSSNGKVSIVGSPFHHSSKGKVTIQRYDSSLKKWTPVGREIRGLQNNDEFGKAVAISESGLVIAVGAPNRFGSLGAVSIFRYDSPTDEWEQIGEEIIGLVGGEKFGSSLAMSSTGNVIAIGAPHAQYQPGKVRVYKYKGGGENGVGHEWEKVGNDITGENDDDEAGFAIDLMEYELDLYIGVGAPMDELTSGSASVYRLDRGTQTWEQLGRRYVDGDVEGTNLGRSVSLGHDGTTVLFAVGFPGPGKDATSEIKSGVEVYSITYDGKWDYYGQFIYPKEQYDDTGFNVALSFDGQTLAISSPQYGRSKGLVRVYKYDKSTNPKAPYKQFGTDMYGQNDGDEFGYSLTISKDGSTVTAGAPESFYVATYVAADDWDGPAIYYSSVMSALVIVVMTLLIAILVTLVSYFTIKVFRRYRSTSTTVSKHFSPARTPTKKRGKFTPVKNANHKEDSIGSPQTVAFPVLDQHIDVNQAEDDDGSEVSFEEEDGIDYETHLRNIT